MRNSRLKSVFDLDALAERIVRIGTPAIEASIHREAHYLMAYPALLHLGKEAIDDKRLICLELAIYGWLPTIMRTRPSAVFSKTTVSDARNAQSKDEGIQILKETLDCGPKGHSWIAVSKVLHAINPSVFPILDRRVAEAFGRNPTSLRSQNALIAFALAMHQAPPSLSPVISDAKARVRMQFGYEMTDIRALELILFAMGSTANINNLLTL